MKTFHAVSALLATCCFIISCKTSSPTSPTTTTTGVPTAIGTPVGSPATGTIDASGGSLLSPDGRLEVVVPAGALATATSISVQPITNETPGGVGVGFSMLPNGQTFSKPVTLTFHYSPDDLAGTDANALAVAVQKDDRIWYEFNTSSLDESAGTLSITTSHFSNYDLLSRFRIAPDHAEINVNKTQSLEVRIATPATVDNDPPMS